MTNDTRALGHRFPLAALIALAASSFMSVTIEMLPTGLMHLMAPDLQVSDPDIGLLMSVFAFTVVVTSTPLMVLFRRVPKHVLLVSVLTVFALGSIGTAFAPTYPLVLVTRIFTGLAHGVFWASVTAYTGLIVTRSQLTKAVSITGGGGGLAFVLGVPLGTALGGWLGWRVTFLALAVLCLLVAAILWWILPRIAPGSDAPETREIEVIAAPGPIGDAERIETGSIRRPVRVAPEPRSMSRVVLLCLLVGVIMTGQYGFYSYITPYLLDQTGLPEVLLAGALFVYGIAAAVATVVTGLVFTGRPLLGFYLTAGLMLGGGVLMLAAPTVLPVVALALLMWGAGMGFMPTLLQSRLLTVAPPAQRDVSSALYTTGFNLGISLGAFVGGELLRNLGIRAPGWFFVAMISAAILYRLVLDAVSRRASRPEAESGDLSR